MGFNFSRSLEMGRLALGKNRSLDCISLVVLDRWLSYLLITFSNNIHPLDPLVRFLYAFSSPQNLRYLK